MHREVAIINLGPGHPVVLNELLPLRLRIVFIDADDRNLGGINFTGQILQEWQRNAARLAPGAPEVQQDHFPSERIEIDFLSIAELCGKLGSEMLANAAGVGNESLDLTRSRSAGKFRGHSLESLCTLSVFGFLEQHKAQIELAFHARRICSRCRLEGRFRLPEITLPG